MRAICTACAAIGVAVSLTAARPAGVSAQEGWQTRGMFGPRTLGQPLSPLPSQRFSGLQTGPSGNFVGIGRPQGGNMLPTPWRQVQPAPVVLPTFLGEYGTVISPAMPQAAPMQAAPPVQMMPAAEAGEQAMPAQMQPAAEGVQGDAAIEGGAEGGSAGIGEAAAGMMSGAAAIGPAAQPAFKWARPTSTYGRPAVRPESFRVSPELSARMTRIAQARGLTTPAGITVALGERTVVLRGTVTSPQARATLANVARLEPGISYVENQLTVQP